MIKLLLEAYEKVNGHIFALIGIAVSGIPIYFNFEKESISLKVLFPIFTVLFFIFTVIFKALLISVSQQKLPKMVKGLDTIKPYDEFSFLILLEPFELFTFKTILSVFRDSDGVEEYIGIGQILNVQQDKKLLVGVKLFQEKEEIVKKIIANDKTLIKNIIIKPGVGA